MNLSMKNMNMNMNMHMKVFSSSSKEEGNEGGRKRDRFKGLFG